MEGLQLNRLANVPSSVVGPPWCHSRRNIRIVVEYSVGTDELLLKGSAALLRYHAKWLRTVWKGLSSMAKPKPYSNPFSRMNLAVDI